MSDAPAHSRSAGTAPERFALIADDVAGVHLTISAAIRAVDPTITVLSAESGRAAYGILVARRPEIAFLSIQLPEMTGAETLAMAQGQGVRPLAILMSSLVVPRWIELCKELDVHEFLKKPFDPEHVTELLKAHQRMQQPMRLLLVDGSVAARHLIRRMLDSSRFTFEIDETDNGAHALKLMKLAHYDVAILDAALSGMDGLETACQARDISPDTKILLMSGTNRGAIAKAARHFGVLACLTKPFYARDVDYVLHTIFDLRRPYLLNARLPKPATAAAR